MDQPRKPSNPSKTDIASGLVQDILNQKVEQRKRQEKKPESEERSHRLRRITLLVLFPVFLVLAAWNLLRTRQPPQVFTPAEVDAGVRLRIYLAVQAAQAYRDSVGRWPESLDDVGISNQGLSYERMDTTFQIVGTSGPVTFTYRNGDDLAFYRDAALELKR